MKVDFYKSRWSELALFPTMFLDFEFKHIDLMWLWFDITIKVGEKE